MNVSALGNVWYTAIMNSADEVADVRNLPEQQSINASVCNFGHFGILGIQGSANIAPIAIFNFSEVYIPNFSGMLCDTIFIYLTSN